MKIKRISLHTIREMILFLIGGFVYHSIEIGFRRYSHWSMFILGGICFVLIGLLNEWFTNDIPLISQMFISMIIITTLEFLFGCILNLWLKLGIWDYSYQPYNLCGQICLLFTNIWFLLSSIGIILDDYIRWIFFREEKPHYRIFM